MSAREQTLQAALDELGKLYRASEAENDALRLERDQAVAGSREMNRQRAIAEAEVVLLRRALEPFAHAAVFWEIESQTDEGAQLLVKPGSGFASALTVKAFRDARREIRRERKS